MPEKDHFTYHNVFIYHEFEGNRHRLGTYDGVEISNSGWVGYQEIARMQMVAACGCNLAFAGFTDYWIDEFPEKVIGYAPAVKRLSFEVPT